MMRQPDRFGQFLLFQQTEVNSYRTCYRAGLVKGRAIERIVRLELFDQTDIDRQGLLGSLGSSSDLVDQLEDPHIATGLSFGQVDGVPYAAYDFELGTTLADFLVVARKQAFPVPFDQALFIAERIALALAAAFQVERQGRPVLHSFLTPDSILLTNEGQVKVSGFEVGHSLQDQLAEKTFCAPYLSPQSRHSRSGQAALAHDDVFSLGSILYELVTGEPLSALSTDPGDLSQLTVHATGEPAPESLRVLLEGSFAPPATRIADVLDWQQCLGKLILDGEYNPTTFNLAFMLHTLLRDALEGGEDSLKKEKRFVLAPRPKEESVIDEGKTETLAGSRALEGETARLDLDPEPGTLAPIGETPPRDVDSSDRRPFWLGFSVSGISASALLGVFLVFGGGLDEAPASPAALAERASSDSVEGITRQPGGREIPAGPATSSAVSPDARDETAAVVLTEVVNGELGQVANNQAIEVAIAERTDEIERSLKAEYEEQLESLRSRLVDNQHHEERVEGTPRSVPSSDGAGLETPLDAGRVEAAETPFVAKTSVEESPERGVSTETASDFSDRPGATPAHEPLDLEAPFETVDSTAKTLPPTRPTATEVALQPAPPKQPPAALTTPGVASRRAASTVPANPGDEANPGGEPSSAAPAVTPAQLLKLNPPAYPEAARRLGLSATARVRVLVSTLGRVKEAQIEGPPLGGGFDRAALQAVRRSRWKPATRDGSPIEAWSVLTLQFKP